MRSPRGVAIVLIDLEAAQSPMFTPEPIVQECLQYRSQAIERLLSRGALEDAVLRAESAFPGADNRLGAALIARPPLALTRCLRSWQEQLRAIDAQQYFYPAKDLHMTLLLLGFELDAEQLRAACTITRRVLSELMGESAAPNLVPLLVSLDQQSCALHLVPTDESLWQFRQSVTEELKRNGLEGSVVKSGSAHINFMRFLKNDPQTLAQLARFVQSLRVPELRWQVDRAYISAGSPRYGSRERTMQIGPFLFGATGLWRTQPISVELQHKRSRMPENRPQNVGVHTPG